MTEQQQSNYEQLLQEVVNRVSKEELLSEQAIEDWLSRSNEMLASSGDLSSDEVELMKKYLRRDLQAFAQEMHEQEGASVWLGTIKDTLWHGLVDITDKTQVEWLELSEDLSHDGIYRSHEWVGLGVLCCTNCGHQQEIYHPTRLTRCIECGNDAFHRKPFKP